MAAAFINFGIYLEISTLAFPGQFLILASISAALKNITYLLFSASRQKDNLKFALRDNMGDLTGKSVSQFTASSLGGICTGTVLSYIIDIGSITQMLPVLGCLSAIVLTCGYRIAFIIDETRLNN